MSSEDFRHRDQILLSIGLVTISFLYGIPLIDIANTQDVLHSLVGKPNSCEELSSSDSAEAIIFLSAGNDNIKNTEPNYHEKRRMDAVVYEYLRLLESGTPPRVIILALDDGIIKNHKVRNYIQTITSKNSPETAMPNDLFVTIHAEHTDTSLVEARKVLDSLGITGPIAVVTSEPHVNRARYNSCRYDILGYTLSADKVISTSDPDTYKQMERLKQLRSYKIAWAIEQAKLLSWMWRPNNLGD